MTYKFDFSSDYGYELSNYDINAINELKSIEEKGVYCSSILERENGYRKIEKRRGADVVRFFSENGYLMFSVYCIND